MLNLFFWMIFVFEFWVYIFSVLFVGVVDVVIMILFIRVDVFS